ncbi:hypothetical protein SeMB42_g00011 [Synchytrium endobioticum]|uniref:Zinc/iron permease n=1 Tax=Synchytrium endobioticum TaxID=286115 RepID=A0A507DC21_9FUNG|nr:hypothetical protein SeLEV6574_g02066 [Synchytrium endobioticum]TPX55027.1 hypothetical protein SeMB42_g00011 [Synchytrium endobioticum]
MNPFPHLLLLSVLTFVGSFLAGSIPLALSLKEEQLRLVSTLGAGLMIGTALTVILPEGVDTLYNVQLKATSDISSNQDVGTLAAVRQAAIQATTNPTKSRALRAVSDPAEDVSATSRNLKPHGHSGGTINRIVARDTTSSPTPPSDPPGGETKDDHESHFQAHKYIGPALSAGFIFMFLLEHLGPTAHPHVQDDVAASNLAVSSNAAVESKARHTLPATIGLLVHCAADGVALGAAASSANDNIEFIVFLAIILHKAPSALGYTIFLMHEGHTRRSVRQHLIAFAASVPISAILTFGVLHSVFAVDHNDDADASGRTLDMSKWTGLLLLFSAGTFLYVATVHILPEIYGNSNNVGNSHRRGSAPGDGENGVLLANRSNDERRRQGNGHAHGEKVLSKMQLVAWVLGAVAPFLLAFEHSH